MNKLPQYLDFIQLQSAIMNLTDTAVYTYPATYLAFLISDNGIVFIDSFSCKQNKMIIIFIQFQLLYQTTINISIMIVKQHLYKKEMQIPH